MLTLFALMLLAAPPDAGVADLGVRIDFPRPGAKLEGQWTAVTGWYDPKRFGLVAVVGAQVEGFYLPMGHVGVPMVPLFIDGDGGFVAPRVPLLDGGNQLAAVPMGRSGYHQPAVVEVTASAAGVAPVAVDAAPSAGQVPVEVTLTARAAKSATRWEWSYDFGRTFESGAASVKHRFTEANPQPVLVRGEVGGAWVYGTVSLSLTRPSKVLRETKAVTQPSRIVAVTAARFGDNSHPQSVDRLLVLDGDLVRVFDAALKPTVVLRGLKSPRGVAGGKAGTIYVADTGNDRLVRFTADGKLDASFGVKGAATRIGDTVLKGVREVFVDINGEWGPDGGLQQGKEELTLLLGDGMVMECKEGKCRDTELFWNHPNFKPAHIDVAPGEKADSSGVIYQADGGWFDRDMSGGPRPMSTLPRVFATAATSYEPYHVGLEKDGTLVELLFGKVARRQKPPFPITAVATNPWGEQWEPGQRKPIHLYLAGKGVLQERVFDPLYPPL